MRGSAHHLFNLFIAQALHDGIDVIRGNVGVDGNEHLINEVLVGNPVAGFFCIPAGHFSQLLSAGDGDEVEGEVNGQAVFAAAGAALRTGNQCVVGSGKHSCGLGRNSLDSNQVNAGVAGRVFGVECGFQGGAQGADAGDLDVDAEALFHFVNHGSTLVVGLAGAQEHLVVAGLQQGTVDGFEMMITPLYTNGFYDLLDHCCLTQINFSVNPMLISETLFQSLSTEDQEILMRAAREAAVYEREKIAAFTDECVKLLEEKGMSFDTIDLVPCKEAVASVIDKYADSIGADVIENFRAIMDEE